MSWLPVGTLRGLCGRRVARGEAVDVDLVRARATERPTATASAASRAQLEAMHRPIRVA